MATTQGYFTPEERQTILQLVKEVNDKLQLTVKEVSTVTQALELLREMLQA